MKDQDFYDNMTLHLERLNDGLALLKEQVSRDAGPSPEGFWFSHAGLRRASKKLRRNLDKWRDDKTPTDKAKDGPRLVEG